MSLCGIAVMNVGLVSGPLFLHWLKSLFLSSWGNAFKDQESFLGSWVRFLWQCFQELGRNAAPQALGAVELLGRAVVFGAEWAKPVPWTESMVWTVWTNTGLGEEENSVTGGSEWCHCYCAPEEAEQCDPAPAPWHFCGCCVQHSPSALCL